MTIRNSVFCTAGQRTHEAVTACPRPPHPQARPNPIMKRDTGHTFLLLAEEQLVADSCWLGVKGGEEGRSGGAGGGRANVIKT